LYLALGAEAFIASSDVSVGKIWPLPRPAL